MSAAPTNTWPSSDNAMKIGIGLPGNIPGTEGDFILEWARRADAGSFSTLGAISNGRLTLGFGVGRRPDDYKAAPTQYNNKGHRLEEQITTMRCIWKGEDVDPENDVCPWARRRYRRAARRF